jgi:general secretion pathway protein B
MSFILDALKKSEVERQRQTTPGLIETAVAPRRSRVALWLIVLGGLLAINFAVLLFVLLRGSATPAAPPISAARPAATEAQAASAAPEHFSPMDAPVYAPEIPVAPNAPPAAGKPSPAPHVAAPAPAPAAAKPSPAPHVAAPAPAPAAAADENDKPENTELLPLISEVDLGSLALPELHLDVHVYATKPAERFVYINMRKYHEGATLEEGPVIERIRRDGVVLNFHGVRFILPRAVGQ